MCDVAYALLIERVNAQVATVAQAAIVRGGTPPDPAVYREQLDEAINAPFEALDLDKHAVLVAIGLKEITSGADR